MDLTAKHIVILGLARSGLAAARFLIQKGAEVVITDAAPAENLAAQARKARDMGAELALGGHPAHIFDRADLIVLSPGVPHTLKPLLQAEARGIEVIGEMELASRFIDAPIVAVTGTNGKTTTTDLIGHMLISAGKKVFVGGNIGTPLIDYAAAPVDDTFAVVAEVSSFQLDTIKTFHPKVAVLLNISADHFDRYDDMNAYVFSKGRIFENQKAGDIAVYNSNDPHITALMPAVKSQKTGFGHLAHDNGAEEEKKALIDGSRILIHCKGRPPKQFDLNASSLWGPHNMENAAAAILAVKALNIDDESIQTALNTFAMQPHRLEQVKTINGVTYVNDSKATNVDAVARALTCFSNPVILIMGGRNKNNDFRPLLELVNRHVATLITYGEAGDEIQTALKGACSGRSQARHDFKEAVLLAHHLAQTGQTVLLSPACASFDQFDSYAHRGETFRNIVETLE